MGKGDKKTKRGKINRGSYGVRRPRIKKKVKPEDKISVTKKIKP
jgi:30S ribosomal protein S31